MKEMDCQNKSYELCETCSHRESCEQRVTEPTTICEMRSAIECHFCDYRYSCDQRIKTYCKNPCYNLCKDCREQDCPNRVEPGLKDELKEIVKALIMIMCLFTAVFLVFYCASIVLASQYREIIIGIYLVVLICVMVFNWYIKH